MDKPKLELTASRHFAAWLAGSKASLAFTTYQAGKLFLIGMRPDGRLSIFQRSFPRCMGLGIGQGGTLWMSSLYQLWRLENFLDPGNARDDFDAVYVPVNGHTTGDIDIHDVHADAAGRPIFVATRFNCLATLTERASFAQLWRPPFVDRLVAEDRCHLNGFAAKEGRPAFASCVAATNVAAGWREHRRDGGRIIDIATGVLTDESDERVFTHPVLCLTILPHRGRPEHEIWKRVNGPYTLMVQPTADHDGTYHGVPHGSKARLILLYLQTEAVKTNSRVIELGTSMRHWLRTMGVTITGPNYQEVRRQALKIERALVSFTFTGEGTTISWQDTIIRGSFERPCSDEVRTVELSESFFKSITERPVPVCETAIIWRNGGKALQYCESSQRSASGS